MPKVSIVVPIYNVEKYLNECLLSLKKQTLDDIEIICVDDGSTDTSLKICRDFAATDDRFRVITKENKGYGHTVNVGIKSATGDYVGIVESDDYVGAEMFDNLYRAAVRYRADIVKSDYYELFTKDNPREEYVMTPTDKSFYNRPISAHDTEEIYHFKMNTWTGIYKREFLQRFKILHNETPGAAYQDNGFWFKTISLAGRVIFLNKAYYRYRQDNPTSSINSKDKVFCMCDEYAHIREFIEEYPDIKRAHLQTFLAKKYFNYLYTYRRIGEKYKIPFLKRFSEEFRLSRECGELGRNVLDGSNMAILKRIMSDPVQFYYDDTVWVLNREYAALSNIKAAVEERKQKGNGA